MKISKNNIIMGAIGVATGAVLVTASVKIVERRYRKQNRVLKKRSDELNEKLNKMQMKLAKLEERTGIYSDCYRENTDKLIDLLNSITIIDEKIEVVNDELINNNKYESAIKSNKHEINNCIKDVSKIDNKLKSFIEKIGNRGLVVENQDLSEIQNKIDENEKLVTDFKKVLNEVKLGQGSLSERIDECTDLVDETQEFLNTAFGRKTIDHIMSTKDMINNKEINNCKDELMNKVIKESEKIAEVKDKIYLVKNEKSKDEVKKELEIKTQIDEIAVDGESQIFQEDEESKPKRKSGSRKTETKKTEEPKSKKKTETKKKAEVRKGSKKK